MKHLFNKLSAFLVMLMCMSATVQAEIVHHEVCEPTLSSRGFTVECWENTETGKIYSDAACTHELVNRDLALAVVYAKQPRRPITNSAYYDLSEDENNFDVQFHWLAKRTYAQAGHHPIVDMEPMGVTFTASNENVKYARLKWMKDQGSPDNGEFKIRIYVNNSEVYCLDQGVADVEGVFIFSLPELKTGDQVKFETQQTGDGNWPDASPTFKASLEYTFDCNHEFPGDSRTCSKCGYTVPENMAHHSECAPTESTRGFTASCWEDTNTGKFYFDPFCTQELAGAELAKTVVYAKLQTNPITEKSEFEVLESDNQETWDINLNWAAETTFSNAYNNWSSTPRYAKFTVDGDNVANARMVWMKNQGAIEQGKYTIKIYVNDVEKASIGQTTTLEGVFVQPIPELKKGDVVKFEVTQNERATYSTASPTFKACLEYTGKYACKHEYPEGSAICSKCGYVKEHEHNYVNHECTLCGATEQGFMVGYVGADADRKNISWVLDESANVLTFTGTGKLETFNSEHNVWRNEHKTTVTKVVIGEGITNIGDGAYPNGYFSGMSGLTEVILPSTLKTIGSYGFQDCINLNSITLPEGLETIMPCSMENCKKLTVITLPSTLKTIGDEAFAGCSGLTDIYVVGIKEIYASLYAFKGINTRAINLHVKCELYDWATSNNPWSDFNIPRPYNILYTDAEGVKHLYEFNPQATDNTWTLTDGGKKLTIYEDIPMQTLTYTRNFSAANTWQALYVPFEMAYSDWAGKFDVAAITNFHEYTDENGETEKIELEVRYVKNGKLRANTPYLIRAKAAGEQTIVVNDVTLQTTVSKSIDCRSTEREYTFTGTYEAIDGLQTKDYIFVSGGRLCKAGNDTDVLKPMRWYLTITERGSMTINPSPALAKPITIHVIGEDDTTGIEDITVVSSSLNAKASGIYSISGVKLAKPQKGINIINGKKVNVR